MRAGWKIVPFVDAVEDASGGNPKIPQSEFLQAGRFAVVDQGKDLVAGFTDDRSLLCRAVGPVIVFGDHTRCFKYVDFPFAMGADGVKVLRPKGDIGARYLYHYLSQVRLPEGGYARHFKHLKRIDVVVPPPSEQVRIATVLDRAETLRRQRRDSLDSTSQLPSSIFVETFGDPTASRTRWPKRELRTLGRVVTGRTPPGGKSGMFGGPIPFMTPGDLEGGDSPKRTLTEAGAAEVEIVRSGSTLVCCIGATIGKMATAIGRSAFNQQINAVEWDGEVDDRYGLEVLRFFRSRIAAWGKSTTLPILKKSRFERIEVPVPPLDLQREFARRVQVVERLRDAQRASMAAMDVLYASIQERAFAGRM